MISQRQPARPEGFPVRHAAQRHWRADAQRRACDHNRGNRGRKLVLRGPSVGQQISQSQRSKPSNKRFTRIGPRRVSGSRSSALVTRGSSSKRATTEARRDTCAHAFVSRESPRSHSPWSILQVLFQTVPGRRHMAQSRGNAFQGCFDETPAWAYATIAHGVASDQPHSSRLVAAGKVFKSLVVPVRCGPR
jgi:hypothetical protein